MISLVGWFFFINDKEINQKFKRKKIFKSKKKKYVCYSFRRTFGDVIPMLTALQQKKKEYVLLSVERRLWAF